MLLAGIVASAQPQVVVAQEGGRLFTGARGLQRRPGARATRLGQLDDSLHDSWVTAYLGLSHTRGVGAEVAVAGGVGLLELSDVGVRGHVHVVVGVDQAEARAGLLPRPLARGLPASVREAVREAGHLGAVALLSHAAAH